MRLRSHSSDLHSQATATLAQFIKNHRPNSMQTLTNTTNDIETNDSGGTTAPFNFANSGQVTNSNGETNVTTRAETNVNSSGENGGSRSGVSVPLGEAGGDGGGGLPDGPGGVVGGPGGGAILPVVGPIRRRPYSI